MTLRPYKFLVVPVMQRVDEDGNVLDEVQPNQPDHVFGLDGLRQYADKFPVVLAQLEAAQSNGSEVVVSNAELEQ